MKKAIVFLVLCVIVKGGCKHHPKFPRMPKLACSDTQHNERSALIEGARCGPPKEVFVVLPPRTSYEEIHPGAVWVKRCVGLCAHEGPDSKCVARETSIKQVPVKVINVRTNKETCSSYPVEEHVTCQCCTIGPEDCAAPRVFNPRKCSCQCPNTDERRACLAQRGSGMKWNRSKCICEARRRVPNTDGPRNV